MDLPRTASGRKAVAVAGALSSRSGRKPVRGGTPVGKRTPKARRSATSTPHPSRLGACHDRSPLFGSGAAAASPVAAPGAGAIVPGGGLPRDLPPKRPIEMLSGVVAGPLGGCQAAAETESILILTRGSAYPGGEATHVFDWASPPKGPSERVANQRPGAGGMASPASVLLGPDAGGMASPASAHSATHFVDQGLPGQRGVLRHDWAPGGGGAACIGGIQIEPGGDPTTPPSASSCEPAPHGKAASCKPAPTAEPPVSAG